MSALTWNVSNRCQFSRLQGTGRMDPDYIPGLKVSWSSSTVLRSNKPPYWAALMKIKSYGVIVVGRKRCGKDGILSRR
jgi:hypothetical protein